MRSPPKREPGPGEAPRAAPDAPSGRTLEGLLEPLGASFLILVGFSCMLAAAWPPATIAYGRTSGARLTPRVASTGTPAAKESGPRVESELAATPEKRPGREEGANPPEATASSSQREPAEEPLHLAHQPPARLRVELSFRSGSARLDPAELGASLSTLADAAVPCPKAPVIVEGHADAIGDPNSNLALSWRRARAVARRLESMGIASARMTVRAFGAYQPKVAIDGTSAAQRRVEVRLEGCASAARSSDEAGVSPRTAPSLGGRP